MFAEDLARGVALQLGAGVGGGDPEGLAGGHLMVGPLDPVAPELRQEDEREGAFSAQYLVRIKETNNHRETHRGRRSEVGGRRSEAGVRGRLGKAVAVQTDGKC